jgi:hypothetical protein
MLHMKHRPILSYIFYIASLFLDRRLPLSFALVTWSTNLANDVWINRGLSFLRSLFSVVRTPFALCFVIRSKFVVARVKGISFPRQGYSSPSRAYCTVQKLSETLEQPHRKFITSVPYYATFLLSQATNKPSPAWNTPYAAYGGTSKTIGWYFPYETGTEIRNPN